MATYPAGNNSWGTCTYIHRYMNTYIHTCTHTYIRTHIHTYIHAYVHTYIHTCTEAIKAAATELVVLRFSLHRSCHLDILTLKDLPRN